MKVLMDLPAVVSKATLDRLIRKDWQTGQRKSQTMPMIAGRVNSTPAIYRLCFMDSRLRAALAVLLMAGPPWW